MGVPDHVAFHRTSKTRLENPEDTTLLETDERISEGLEKSTLLPHRHQVLLALSLYRVHAKVGRVYDYCLVPLVENGLEPTR